MIVNNYISSYSSTSLWRSCTGSQFCPGTHLQTCHCSCLYDKVIKIALSST